MASDLPTSTRVLGGTEENWFKSSSGGTGILAFGSVFRRSIDLRHIHAATQVLLERHALLRGQIVENAKGKLCIQIGSSSGHEVQEKPWPSLEGMENDGVMIFPGDDSGKAGSLALHKIITEELNASYLNAEGKASPPLDVFQTHVYANPTKALTVIILKLHSAALDRHSCNIVAQDFLVALNASVGGRSPHLPESSDAESLLPPMEDMIPKGKASKGLLQKGFDAVGYAVNSKKYSLLPFQPNFSGSSAKQVPFRSDVVSLSLGKEGTASLFASCKQESTTSAAALAAAFLLAASNSKELKEKKLDEFSFTCVTDCRSYLEPELSERTLGHYTAGFPGNEKAKEGTSFWDLARRISAAIEKDVAKAKYFSEMAVLGMLFSQVMKHPNLTPSNSLRTALFSLFVDGLLKAQYKDTTELSLLGSLGPFSSMHFVGPCFSLGEALLDGPELLLSFVFPSPLYTRAQMLSFLHSSVDLLHDSVRNM